MGVEPWLAAGARDPLSTNLIPNYDVDLASGSTRRWQGAVLAEAQARAPLSNDPLSMFVP